MVGKLEGPAFDSWKYEQVIKPLSSLGTGSNGTGTFFRGTVADLLAQQEQIHTPGAVISALETIFARRAAENPNDKKSPTEAADFIAKVRSSVEQTIAEKKGI